MLAILRIVQFENPEDFNSKVLFQKYFTIKDGEIMVLGRSSATNWQIPDPMASSTHLSFKMVGGMILINDLNSKNGTKLNQVKITSRTNLYLDDVITLGDTYIHIDADHTPLESRMKLRSPNGRDDEYASETDWSSLTRPNIKIDDVD